MLLFLLEFKRKTKRFNYPLRSYNTNQTNIYNLLTKGAVKGQNLAAFLLLGARDRDVIFLS